MRENPPLATTGCDKVLCTVATEISKHHWTLPNEGRWAKRETPKQHHLVPGKNWKILAVTTLCLDDVFVKYVLPSPVHKAACL